MKKLVVAVKCQNTKNKRQALIPLREDTAALLGEHFKNKLTHVKAFNIPKLARVADMLKEDCEAAGIETQDTGAGKVVFHSLRHSTAQMLKESGVHPHDAQAILRHADIRTTMEIYTDHKVEHERNAINRLPDFGDFQEKQRATGTCEVAGSEMAEKVVPRSLPFGGAKTDKNGHFVDNMPINSIGSKKP